MSNIKLYWQQLDYNHFRLKVPGGWLVKTFEDVTHYRQDTCTFDQGHDFRCAMCFIPDPEYKWLETETILYGEVNE